VAALWIGGAVVASLGALAGHDVRVDSSGNLLVLSGSTTGPDAWFGVVQSVFFPVLTLCWLASICGQAASYRRSSGERRQQLKWLLAGAVVSVVGLLLGLMLATALNGTSGPLGLLYTIVAVAGLLALPVCMGVAIFKYRLFDIDRIISRTLAYTIVTGLLVGVYAGLVLLATHILAFSGAASVAAATLAAAALFGPLRRWVQHAVDRRFNRARYDADAAIAAFAARLQDAVDLDTVRADLLTAVYQALEPAHVSVWLPGGRP